MQESKYSDEIDRETRNRIRLSLAAYGYEFKEESIMTDAEFDRLSRSIDLGVDTRRPDLDKFFREEFNHSTGMWIHKHPELNKIASIYEKFL